MSVSDNFVTVSLGNLVDVCFVAMPFAPIFTSEYELVIKPAVEAAGLQCVRGDELYSRGGVVPDIWKALRGCRLVVAELSGRNPNVLYEVGLAHAIGKPVIFLTRREKDVPFDLKSLRYLFYETKDPFWGRSLAGEITRMITSVLSDQQARPHLDGIRAALARPALELTHHDATNYSGVLDSTFWVAEWGAEPNRHNGALLVRQRRSQLFGALAVTHYHDGSVTIVHEVLNGIIEDRRVSLNGTAYTFLTQGKCGGYGLDAFDLHLSGDGVTLTGTIPQRTRRGEMLDTHAVTFTRVRPEDLPAANKPLQPTSGIGPAQ